MFIDLLQKDEQALRSFSLISRSWCSRARLYSFRELTLKPARADNGTQRLSFLPRLRRLQELSPNTCRSVRHVCVEGGDVYGLYSDQPTIDTGFLQQVLQLFTNLEDLLLSCRMVQSKSDPTGNNRYHDKFTSPRALKTLTLRLDVRVGHDIYPHNVFGLLSSLETLCLDCCYVMIRPPGHFRFPDLQRLTIRAGTTGDFLNDLFWTEGHHVDLRSLSSLHVELDDIPFTELNKILVSASNSLHELHLGGLLQYISHYLYMGFLGTVIDDPSSLWAGINFDACSALAHLQLHCVVENPSILPNLPQAVMPAILSILTFFSSSAHACRLTSKDHGLSITIDLEVVSPDLELLQYLFLVSPWARFRNILSSLQQTHGLRRLRFLLRDGLGREESLSGYQFRETMMPVKQALQDMSEAGLVIFE
ncbi:unnamed protein product [Somion occarium]